LACSVPVKFLSDACPGQQAFLVAISNAKQVLSFHLRRLFVSVSALERPLLSLSPFSRATSFRQSSVVADWTVTMLSKVFLSPRRVRALRNPPGWRASQGSENDLYHQRVLQSINLCKSNLKSADEVMDSRAIRSVTRIFYVLVDPAADVTRHPG
jgi:hypothetical protein